MVAVKLFYREKILVGIEAKGHSGFSQKGFDIICAAVSALMQSLILGLEDIAKLSTAEIFINEKAPIIRATWPESDAEKVFLLTQTTAASLTQIAKENPRYVKIYSEELKS